MCSSCFVVQWCNEDDLAWTWILDFFLGFLDFSLLTFADV